MSKKHFALDIYMSRMFKIIMCFVPLLALSAGITFTVLKGAGGFYQNVPWHLLIIFDCTNVFYCGLGAYFAFRCEDNEKNLKNKYVIAGKIVIAIIIVIQWNFISYMIPSRDYWAFFALFIFVSIFFLDSKYVLLNIVTVLSSIVISWIIYGDNLLPIKTDPNFIPEVILRCILMLFVCLMMYLITYIVERLLVKELENIAEYDSLTLLRNRRTLHYKIDEAIENFNKNNKQFCFFMADIDDFKVVNDTYGHPFGDVVLKNIANTFLINAANNHLIFRFGGEEICGIIHGNLESAIELLEKNRIEISEMTNTKDNDNAKVTISVGVMEYKSGLSMDDIIKIADSNLYYAKSHGKNIVVC